MATYTEISAVNAEIETTDIKGKAYAEVNQRIKAFRKLYPMGTIHTEMLSNANGICVFKASVYADGDPTVNSLLGTGHAYEKESEGFINKTSYIENCETSAVGRALAMCGIGIDVAIRSADEVKNAQAQQERAEKESTMNVNARVALLELCNKSAKTFTESILKHYEVDSINNMTTEQCIEALAQAKKYLDNKKDK